MKQIDRITYNGFLPESFFNIPVTIYKNLSFRPEEDPHVVAKLFAMEAVRNEIIIYTDHNNIRLVGIFPLNETTAYFGFWEGVHDDALNKEAFDLLEEDTITRHRTTLVGPVNFNTYHNYRLRIGEAPSWNMFDREPVNPAWYPLLLQQFGFNDQSTFESRLIRKEDIAGVYIDKAALLNEITKIPFDFIPLNEANWKIYEEQIFELVHVIFSKNPLYKTIAPEQFKMLYNRTFSLKLCPYSSVIFCDQLSGRLAAISLCHPNYTSLYPDLHVPDFKKDFNRLDKKVLLAKTVGVHPDFRKQGLMNYLGAYGMMSFRDWYDEIIFCLMRSDNYSLHFTDNINYESVKYVLYEKGL